MKVGKIVATLSGGALIAATVVIGTATTAYAVPDSCSISSSGSDISSYCAGGTGYHRIYVEYRWANPQVGGYGLAIGEWAPVGATSTAHIPAATVLGAVIQKS